MTNKNMIILYVLHCNICVANHASRSLMTKGIMEMKVEARVITRMAEVAMRITMVIIQVIMIMAGVIWILVEAIWTSEEWIFNLSTKH